MTGTRHAEPDRISAVLFDLDGTLLDSLQSHYTVYRKVYAALGLALDEGMYAEHYSPNWYIFYERTQVPKERWPEADRLWLRYYAEESPRRRPGADAVLRAAKGLGKEVGLVTSGDRSRVERDLRRAGWDGLFDVVVCGGDLLERKPLPGPLLYALQHLHVDPPAALYVGDTVEDVTMGRAAGALTAVVLGGFGSRQQLEAMQPDLLFDSLGLLEDWLRQASASAP